jgi:hypothetical protein
VLALVLLGLAGCGDRPIKSEGEECFASSECDTGLVCDLAADPAVCRAMGSGPGPQPDAGPGPVVDAAAGTPDSAPVIFDAAVFDAPPPL